MLCLASTLSCAFVATGGKLAARPRFVSAAPLMSAVVPEGFGSVDFMPAANAANDAAAISGDGVSVISGLVFLLSAVLAFSFAQGFFKGVAQAMDEESGDADKSVKEDASLDSKRTSKDFGWLHADMRMPLPTWQELQDSCYRVGEMNNHYMYLCSKPGQQGNLGKCEVSSDFTRHYGETVYVCRGDPVKDIHGDGYRA